jgi:hypothetical protein
VDGAEHPVRHRPQVGAVLLEVVDLPVGIGHCHILASRRVIRVDVLQQRDLTPSRTQEEQP